MKNICPVCGFSELLEPPYDNEGGSPSYEICPCCGFEYGFHDMSEGISFEQYRDNWIKSGGSWKDNSKRPSEWSLSEQLLNINIIIPSQS